MRNMSSTDGFIKDLRCLCFHFAIPVPSPRVESKQGSTCITTSRYRDSENRSSRRKVRKKSGDGISRARQSRHRSNGRRPIIASWGGCVLAQTSEYEFLDGRFYFPQSSVNWEYLKENGKSKYVNPFGLTLLYDVVLPRGKRQLICQGAVAKFCELKRPWNVMSEYSSFSKGVRLYSLPDAEREVEDATDNISST